MKTPLAAALFIATLLIAVTSAQAMGAGHNPMASVAASPAPAAVAAPAQCRAVPLAGTQQRGGTTRGSCVVTLDATDQAVGGGLRGGRYMALAERLVAER